MRASRRAATARPRRSKTPGSAEYFTDASEALDRDARSAGPVMVAGHSMGGLLAMALAAERPADVAGLVLVEPVYNPSGTPHAAGLLAAVGAAG